MVAARQRKPHNPFILATPVAKKLKVLLYGPSGSGKTIAALTFPKVAYINAEGGADMYAGRDGIKPFHWFSTKTISDLETALDFIEFDQGKEFETLVIDPITVFYDVLKAAAEKASKDNALGFREWAQINNRMKAVYTRLTNLPVHVVVVGRETTEYEGQGMNLKKAGVKPDADKSLVYIFDFVVHMNANHSGTVEKSRGLILGNNGHIPEVNWGAFEPAASAYKTGRNQRQQSDEEASDAEAETLKRMTDEDIMAFVTHWRGEGLKDAELLTALGVEKGLREFKGFRADADQRVKDWLNAQIEGSSNGDGNKPSDWTQATAFVFWEHWHAKGYGLETMCEALGLPHDAKDRNFDSVWWKPYQGTNATAQAAMTAHVAKLEGAK